MRSEIPDQSPDRPAEGMTFLERRRRAARGLLGQEATRYNPGIRVRDLRRGHDFYSQEEVLGPSPSAVHQGERSNSDEDDQNNPSTAEERVRRRYLEIFYRNSGGGRE